MSSMATAALICYPENKPKTGTDHVFLACDRKKRGPSLISSFAQVDALEMGFLPDLRWGSLGHDASLVERGDPVGDAEGGLQIVLDQEDGDRAVEVHDDVGGEVRLRRREPRHRLVQQQDLRLARER